MIKKILIGLLAILVIIQFIRPSRNEGSGLAANDISVVYADMPKEVHVLLQQKCYDCHSHSTKYPWYANIQPVAWWLADHVEEGKEHLNFSEFKSYDAEKAAHKLEEVVEEVAEGEMPLKSYTFIHRDAVVTAEELALLRNWVASQGVEVEE
jgi:Haem-binding domain